MLSRYMKMDSHNEKFDQMSNTEYRLNYWTCFVKNSLGNKLNKSITMDMGDYSITYKRYNRGPNYLRRMKHDGK